MRAEASYYVLRFTQRSRLTVGFGVFCGCFFGAVVVFSLVLFFWSILSQEHLVYYDFVGIRKTATVVTMSAAIG